MGNRSSGIRETISALVYEGLVSGSSFSAGAEDNRYFPFWNVNRKLNSRIRKIVPFSLGIIYFIVSIGWRTVILKRIGGFKSQMQLFAD